MKSTVVSKLTQLIHDESMKQLAENYHELLPKMVKIDIDHIEEDLSYAVGAAYFMITDRIIFTPIIYRDGAVDSISYIGDSENETLYGLTKKMYKRLISSMKLEFGKPLSKKEESRLITDKGIIGKLFATPQTISPKVASDENYHENVIIDLLRNDHFANSFEKLASMPGYDRILHEVYSDRVFEALERRKSMTKIAAIATAEDGSQTYDKIADLAALPPKHRAEAARAIARDGFYKVASDNSSLRSLVFDIPKMGDVLFKSKSNLEILTAPGIYNALRKDLTMQPVVVARRGDTDKTHIYIGSRSRLVRRGNQEGMRKSADSSYRESMREYIGMEAGALNGDPREHIAGVFGKEVLANDADKIVLIFGKDDIAVYDIEGVTKIGNKLAVNVWESGSNGKIINIGEDYRYINSGDTIYMHPNHVMFVGSKKESGALTSSHEENRADPFSALLDSCDLDETFVKTASHSMTYSAGSYFYENERLSRPAVISKMAEQGYDSDSIHEVIKTAADNAGMPVDFSEVSQTLKAILAEMVESKHSLAELKQLIAQGAQNAGTQTGQDMGGSAQADGNEGQPAQQGETPTSGATQQIMDMAASVGADGKAILEAGKQQGLDEAQIVQQLQTEIAQAKEAQGGAQQGEQPQPTGSAMEQDQAMDQQQDPAMAAGQAQGAQSQVPGQTQGERTPQELQAQGYNTGMSPEMLDQLQEIADKDVLNASIISYLVDTQDAKAVTQQYIEDVTRGVNGLARTLLLIEVQRSNFVDQLGDKQLDSFLSRGKTLLNRMTDFVIDISMID